MRFDDAAIEPRLGLLPDITGILLLAALGGWILLSAEVSGGDPGPAVALVIAGAAVFMASRVLGRMRPWIVPVAVLIAVGITIYQGGMAFFERGPLDPPLGYENANAAFFYQAAAAGMMCAVAARSLLGRAIGVAAAIAGAVLTIATGATGAIVLLVLFPIALLFGGSRRRIRIAATAGAVVVAFVLTMTTLLGTVYVPGERGGTIIKIASVSLEERRLGLWRDAIDLMHDRPAFGVGPGRFSVTSEVALSNRDARWTHNEFLQLGAETGLTGLALLVTFVGLAFFSLGRSDGGYLAPVAVAAVMGTVVQACIDYVWHFPAVPLAAIALFGA